MQRILDGVVRFQNEVFPLKKQLFENLAESQNPQALFITCADSRISPELITQSGPGDLFICRNAGNMVPPFGEVNGGVTATIEYAVNVLNIEEIIVCGHTNCGAMKGVLHPEMVAHTPTVKSWLSHGELARRIVQENYPALTDDALLQVLMEENVVAQLDHLRTHPSVAAKLSRGHLHIHGWSYHIGTGRVNAWDVQRGRFVPIEQYSVITSGPRPRFSQVSNGVTL